VKDLEGIEPTQELHRRRATDLRARPIASPTRSTRRTAS